MSKKEFKKVITFRGDSKDRDSIETLSTAWDCSGGEAIRRALKLVIDLADDENEKLANKESKNHKQNKDSSK